MPSLRKPSVESIRSFLTAQSKLPFSYSAVGATATTPPAGYVVDHTRIKLGEGEPVFHAAKAALERWEHFRLGWVETWPQDVPIKPGEVVAILGRAGGLWWLNSCRIVYVVDESGPITQFGSDESDQSLRGPSRKVFLHRHRCSIPKFVFGKLRSK